MEATGFSETSIRAHQTTWHVNPDYSNTHISIKADRYLTGDSY